MGKLYQGILGGISGKVGNVIGSSWKGIPVIKARPLSVANPRTAGQIAQRSKLSNVVAFAKPVLATVIKPLWDRFAQQESGYNAFISENISLFADEMPSPASDLVVSKGKMASTSITAVGATAGSASVSVAWTPDAGVGLKLGTDEAFVVIVNETKKSVKASAAESTRTEGVYDASAAEAVEVDDVLHVYLAFRRADGTVVSSSAYETEIVS